MSLFQRWGTRLTISTLYHPLTDGQSKVMVKAITEMLTHYVNLRQDDWHNHLAGLEFVYNSGSVTTGRNPFEVDPGYHPHHLGNMLLPSQQTVTIT